MAATRNLLASTKFVLPFLSYQPVMIGDDDPALSAANFIKQTILGPPFTWRWNRSSIEFETTNNGQDYVLMVPDFGFAERYTLSDSDITGKTTVKEIAVKNSLSLEATQQRPASASALEDDNLGNILFRLNTIPDKIYTVTCIYQRKAIPMTSMAATWEPIPDELSYVTDWGLLAILSMITKDQRFPIFRQMFTSHLLGHQDGLTQSQKNIFVGNFLQVLTEPQRATGLAQQGIQARNI